MNCPECRTIPLASSVTECGVIVDRCQRCGGVWLDKGELFYFTRAPSYLLWKLEEAVRSPRPSTRVHPVSGAPLQEISLPLGRDTLAVDYCPTTGGIWLDPGELERLDPGGDHRLNGKGFRPAAAAMKAGLPRAPTLPDLALASGATLIGLYAALTLLLVTLVESGLLGAAPALWIGILIAVLQFGLSPFLMDLSLAWFYRLRWARRADLPEHLVSFVETVCRNHRMKFPRIGLIDDGAPNAFTYGHTPGNARIVITTGLAGLLEPEELEAVMAHEIGHAVHWDMLVMTVANLVPLLCYFIYRTLMSASRGRGQGKSRGYATLAAVGAYLLYLVSEYIVLWFSRVREYFADRFAGEVAGDPGRLASALVKIGYGLAGRDKESPKERKPGLAAVKAMGIFDGTHALALAMTSCQPARMGGEVDKDTLRGAMRWDLWNPWAAWYQLHSTHPLVARRLLALARQAESQGREPYIRFDEPRPESFWDEFAADVSMKMLPLLGALPGVLVLAATGRLDALGLALLGAGLGCAAKTLFAYRAGAFPEITVAGLLKYVKVSGIRPVPCTVRGRVIGKGVPGLIWSEDFVLQDGTGILFLDYRQPLPFWDFLFGLLRGGRYVGRDITATGWYRRAPVPFLEIRRIECDGRSVRCFTYPARLGLSALLAGAGLLLALVL